MRKLALSLLVALSVLASPACKEPDPSKFETYMERIKSDQERGVALNQLEALVKSIVGSTDAAVRDERKQEFVDKVIPVFEEVFDAAQPAERTKMLEMLRIIGRPEGSTIWNKALPLDGSEEGRKQCLLALEGITASKATGSLDALIAEFNSLVEVPGKDKGKREGEVRIAMAQALGELGDPKAVDALIASLGKTKDQQPVAVHRQVAKSLGIIGDPKAIDTLITVQYRVPDIPSTSDVSNRSKLALTSIGAPAVPKLILALQGKNEELNDLINKNDVPLNAVHNWLVATLGDIGDKSAVPDLLAYMTREGCVDPDNPGADKGKKKDDEGEDDADVATIELRAFIARSLGFIGDESAVAPLCSCVNATHNPADMSEIVDAMGRIGGDEALKCLLSTVKEGEFDPELVTNSDFVHEPKWMAARWSVLVAPPDKVGDVKPVLEAAKSDEKVKPHIENLEEALALPESCKDDKACYLKALSDATASVVAREKAAYELARLASGDLEVAKQVAAAFKVRNPEARVTMALFTSRIAEGKSCPECATTLQKVIDGEKGSMDATMQLPVLTARASMAKLHSSGGGDGGDGDDGGGAEAAPAEKGE